MSKDKKPDMYDFFNDDSLWGNQETDALTHEDIMTYSPLKKTKSQRKVLRKIAQERAKNSEWLSKITEANKKNAQDPKIKAKRLASFKKTASTPEFKKELSERAKQTWSDSEYRKRMLSYYNTPEYKEYITKRNKKVAIRDHDKIVERNQALAKDPKWLKANAEAQANRSKNNEEWIRKNCRPVSTPYGIFKRTKEAIEAYCAEHPKERYGSVNLKLRRWYKSDKKPEWKYITWQEYDALKNSE